MVLHIGGDTMIFTCDIIIILDRMSMLSTSKNREIIKRAQKEGRLIGSINEASSFLITQKQGSEIIYCSPISSHTLEKRTQKKFTVA